METKLVLPPNQGQHEIIVREGKAIEVKPEPPIIINGTLLAPFQFLSGRGNINNEQTHIKIEKDKGKITLVLNDKNPHSADVITGELRADSELQKFGINTDYKWEVREFLKFVRIMKFFFAEHSEHDALISSLQSWNVKIERVIKEHNNNTGNSMTQLETKISEHLLKTKFKLAVPIFQGYSKKVFDVEIGFDASNASVKLFLFSYELVQLEREQRESIINEELQKFDTYTFAKVVVS